MKKEMRRESGSLPKINLTHKKSSNGENERLKRKQITKWLKFFLILITLNAKG